MRRHLDAQIDAAAATAIAAGASWADLGRAADMTRQGAMNRWGASRPRALGEMTRAEIERARDHHANQAAELRALVDGR